MTTTTTSKAEAPPAAKAHWRTMHDSNRDGFCASDLMTIMQEEGGVRELHVRIEAAGQGMVKDNDSGKTTRKVAFKFHGIDKLYKSNVTNNNAATSVTGSPFPADWPGHVITLYVGRAERARRKGDPEGTPSTVTVDAVRFRITKPPAGAKVYGEASASAPFDLDAWIAALARCATVTDLDAARRELNTTSKPPREHVGAIKEAIEAARVRIVAGAGL